MQDDNKGALIYYLEVDKNQWKEGVRMLHPNCDIESRPHITILYGLDHSQIDLPKLSKMVHRKPLDIALGEISTFQNNADIVYIKVESIDIEILNHTLREVFKHTITHNTFTPHITLAFANPGTSDHLSGYCPDPESLGLTQRLRGSFYYLTPDKKRILL